MAAWRVLWDNAREEWLAESSPDRDQYMAACGWVWECVISGVPDDALRSPTDRDVFIAAIPGAAADALCVEWSPQMYPLPTI